MREQGEEPSGLLAVQHALADRLVLSKVRARFGGRVKFFISGSAAAATPKSRGGSPRWGC